MRVSSVFAVGALVTLINLKCILLPDHIKPKTTGLMVVEIGVSVGLVQGIRSVSPRQTGAARDRVNGPCGGDCQSEAQIKRPQLKEFSLRKVQSEPSPHRGFISGSVTESKNAVTAVIRIGTTRDQGRNLPPALTS